MRDFSALREPMDVLVVGAGAYGAALARVLAHSGLRVAVVDKGDFGAATSHNSLKIVHGGLRYLQDADLVRLRESVRSQRAWLRCAPHLVRPMRFVMPARGWGARGPAALRLGMWTYHLAALDRNRGVVNSRRLGRGGVRRARSERIHPEAPARGSFRYASWYDAQFADTNRLLWDCLQDAAEAGAVLVNHAEVSALCRAGSRVEGALVEDRVHGGEVEVRARLTVLAVGPWTRQLLVAAGASAAAASPAAWTRNVNIVVPRIWQSTDAIAISAAHAGGSPSEPRRPPRLLFVTPWQDCSIVGTDHVLYGRFPDDVTCAEEELERWIAEIRAAMPGLRLQASDVRYLHVGLTPADETGRLSGRSLLVDHARDGDVAGLVSIAGVKLTTAPDVARVAAAQILRKLNRSARPMDFGQPLRAALLAEPPSPADPPQEPLWSESAWARQVYADRYQDLEAHAGGGGELSPEDKTFRCRVLHGIRREMAVRLRDVVFRCTDRAERGALTRADLRWCADTMQQELGWTQRRREQELDHCLVLLQARRAMPRSDSAVAKTQQAERTGFTETADSGFAASHYGEW